MDDPSISIIIPAYNEESYLGPTLEAIQTAIDELHRRSDSRDTAVQVIVVDNDSTDGTAEVARAHGAKVVHEPRGNVAIARNAGARAAMGNLLIFVDADTLWPASVLRHIVDAMSNADCQGGAVDTKYLPKRIVIRWYIGMWRILGSICGMAQGATQFADASLFATLGGYDEKVYMGEDVDFYWRLGKAARKNGNHVQLVTQARVVPSCRKFDQWPLWKTLFLTNPLLALLFSRSSFPWGGWYQQPIR